MIELKSYSEILIDESPIVVLSCGHFFTAETLDGHMGMTEVYVQDSKGEFFSLRENLGVLAGGVPKCPDCQRPIRQYATQRYNRVINRAVIDEMSKKFLVSGKAEIGNFDRKINQLEDNFEQSKNELISPSFIGLSDRLDARYGIANKLIEDIGDFLHRINYKNQPVRKLFDATVQAFKNTESIDRQIERLSIQGSLINTPRDRRIVMGGRAIRLKTLYTVFADKAGLYRALKPKLNETFPKIHETALSQTSDSFFESCATFISDCNSENLPKHNVEARIYFGQATRIYQALFPRLGTNSKGTELVASAREYLEDAKTLCLQPFQNADELLIGVEQIAKSLRKEWYEPVSAEEIAMIKNAMISASRGIMTHTGHWYNCQNGHPVSLAVSNYSVKVLILV